MAELPNSQPLLSPPPHWGSKTLSPKKDKNPPPSFFHVQKNVLSSFPPLFSHSLLLHLLLKYPCCLYCPGGKGSSCSAPARLHRCWAKPRTIVVGRQVDGFLFPVPDCQGTPEESRQRGRIHPRACHHVYHCHWCLKLSPAPWQPGWSGTGALLSPRTLEMLAATGRRGAELGHASEPREEGRWGILTFFRT